MAAVKRGYTSRTTSVSNTKVNMGKSSNSTVVPCRHFTVENTVHTLGNNVKKTRCAIPASAVIRCRSGVLGLDHSWEIKQTEKRNLPSSASNSGVLTAPRSLVTYLQICRPIVPRVRAVYSGYRTKIPYLHEPKMGNAITYPNDDPALVVYGVPFGHSSPSEKNPEQGSERVHIHVYLPYEQQSARESAKSQSEEEETCSKLTNLSFQEGTNSEIPEDSYIRK